MATQLGSEKLRVIGLLLMTLLPLLASSPTLDSDDSVSESGSDRQTGSRLSEEISDQADTISEGETSHVQVEATKRLWIEELTDKADNAEEAADLIDEIRSRTSSSGLASLKAACKAMCPKCICGVILLPSLPSYRAAKAPKGPKATPRPLAKPATPHTSEKPTVPMVATTKAAAKPIIMKPVGQTTTQNVTPKPTVAKAVMTPHSAHSLVPSSAKKTKKWLGSHVINLESQLPDFLLDEEGNGNAYKREVDDHDPLAESRSSEIGIE